MRSEELRQLQLVQIEILDEAHRVCVENGIKYYLDGGTLLGAVRHGGFIPWDIDIDIAMPREDYERFSAIAPLKLKKGFSYRDFKNTKNFYHPHALICKDNTYLAHKFSKYNPKEENLGIYIDVFPLDRIPQDKKLYQKHKSRLARAIKLRERKAAYRYSADSLKSLAKDLISAAVFWKSLYKANEDFDNICKMYQNTDSELWSSLSGTYGYDRQCMPAENYGEPKPILFEGKEYFGPQHPDRFLAKIYGDYMTLPPENKRKANYEVFETVIFDTKGEAVDEA